MYRLNIRWGNDAHERATYMDVEEYEVKDGILTLTLDDEREVIVPLFQVTAVDVVRED